MASTSIWYKQLENTGSGSSRRYSFNKPVKNTNELDFYLKLFLTVKFKKRYY